jgi:hypothetical protein
MRSYALISAATLLLCPALSGQTAIPASQPPFHVKGTVRDAAGEPVYGVRVAFQSAQTTKSVLTNDAGVYQVDLPLGDYTMSAAGMGFTPYRRPAFRVTAPTNLNFDIVMHAYGNCEIPVFNFSGIVTAEEWAAAQKPSCLPEDFIPVPSRDEPFNISFRYISHARSGSTYTYIGEKTSQRHVPVFVAYNLFSLRANKVIYDSKSRTLRASGKVVAVNDPDTIQRADAMTFTLADGQAIPATQPQTFHVKGTITDANGAVFPDPNVAFHSAGFDKTVAANNVGVYETDLPLGIYRVSADYRQMMRNYNRPLLRAAAPTTLTLNVTLYPMRISCDLVVDAEHWEEVAKAVCGGEDFFPDSSDGDDFHQIYIRYPGRKATDAGYVYGSANPGGAEMPVLVEYNLFSLQADQVIYDSKARTIEASGDVIVTEESGAAQHADSLTFKMENGRATPVR